MRRLSYLGISVNRCSAGEPCVMSKFKEFPLSALQLYATAPYARSYLDEYLVCSQVATPAYLTSVDVYSKLACAGSRRSGIFTYHPHYDDYHVRMSCRVVIDQYLPPRTQRRTAKRYQALEALVVSPTYVEGHYQLYLLYQPVHHAGGGVGHDSRDQYEQFLLQSRVNSCLVEFHELPESPPADKLHMVSMIDVFRNGLSSVYMFYDPTEQKASYGMHNAL